MATHTLNFSTAQVTGLTTTQVAGMTSAQMSPSLAAADLAKINQGIIDDQKITSVNLGPGATAIQPGVIFTATSTKNSASMTSVAIVSPSTATIASIQPGMFVAGVGLSPGSRVLTASGTTITLDRNAVATPTAAQGTTFVATQGPMQGGITNGILTFPGGRGSISIYPNDVIALDILGFPYLIPNTSINFNGGGSGSGAPWLFT